MSSAGVPLCPKRSAPLTYSIGVGALAARSAVMGACLNVKINAAGLKDRTVAEALVNEANDIQALAQQAEKEILAIVENKING